MGWKPGHGYEDLAGRAQKPGWEIGTLGNVHFQMQLRLQCTTVDGQGVPLRVSVFFGAGARVRGNLKKNGPRSCRVHKVAPAAETCVAARIHPVCSPYPAQLSRK